MITLSMTEVEAKFLLQVFRNAELKLIDWRENLPHKFSGYNDNSAYYEEELKKLNEFRVRLIESCDEFKSLISLMEAYFSAI